MLDDEDSYEDDPKARRAAERRMIFESRYKSKVDAVTKSSYRNIWRKIIGETHTYIEAEGSDDETSVFQRITERVAKRRGNLSHVITEEEIPDLSLLESAKVTIY